MSYYLHYLPLEFQLNVCYTYCIFMSFNLFNLLVFLDYILETEFIYFLVHKLSQLYLIGCLIFYLELYFNIYYFISGSFIWLLLKSDYSLIVFSSFSFIKHCFLKSYVLYFLNIWINFDVAYLLTVSASSDLYFFISFYVLWVLTLSLSFFFETWVKAKFLQRFASDSASCLEECLNHPGSKKSYLKCTARNSTDYKNSKKDFSLHSVLDIR